MKDTKKDQACPICLNSNLKLQGHHILPREYGSQKDSPLLFLCATCHLNIHYTAEAEYSGKKPSYLQVEQISRARVYIDAIKRAKAVWESAESTRNLKKKVMFMLPETMLVKLHKVKASRGYKSLDDYLYSIVERELRYAGIE